jgi:N-methylhydantoinase B/oxoprolinase/acetone carboxylase alpha subunit
MSNSLQKHGVHETHKQLRARMKRDGLDTIKVQVTRQAGKLKFDFTGSKEQVVKAQAILANWN